MEERSPRKLAVILHADVVGSTTLVQKNESLAHARIRDTFHRFSGTIEAYNGQPLELRGDALVAEFNRASDAVAASLAFQAENTQFNATLEDDIQPSLRIGISLGEVVIADNTVTGEGVVLAQRLEQLAESGRVCIQGAVYEAVPGRFPFGYESLGEQRLKGFSEPVRAYAVMLKPGEVVPAPEYRAQAVATAVRAPMWPWFLGGVIALLIVIGGGLAWWQPRQPREEPASVERMAFPLPDKPSIAVLPFTNMSGDPEQEYFVDGMSEDLITGLSHISGLFVIARNSTFAYKSKSPDVRAVGRELGVKFVLEGSVRRSGDRVRINAQLIDATTGGHVWAERYDGTLSDVFALQDAVTEKIVNALAVNLTTQEIVQQARYRPGSTHAYDAFLRGWTHFRLQTPDGLAKAVQYLDKAIDIDPGYSYAHAALAAVYWESWNNGWVKSLGTSSFRAMKQAKDHLRFAMEQPTPLVHGVASKILASQGKYDEAVSEAELAVALDINDPAGYVALASALVLAGRPEEGIDAIRTAMRIDPNYPPGYLLVLAQAQFGMDRFDEAAATLKQVVKRNPENEWGWIYLAATYGHLGQKEDGESAIRNFNRLRQEAKLAELNLEYVDQWRFGRDSDRRRVQAGLSEVFVQSEWKTLVTKEGGRWRVDGATEVDAPMAKGLHERGVRFIDVRSERNWKDGHILGAVHIYLYDLTELELSKIVSRNTEVVFYCGGADCGLSPQACAKAIIWGYKKVYHFSDGMPGWRRAGYAVETGE